MSELSAEQIKDFLDPYAFSRPRGEKAVTKTADGVVLPEFGKSKLTTTSLSQSVNVLRTSYDRLEQMLGNLASSRKLAAEAALSSDSVVRDEAYAKLRSLAGGIDVLADKSRFNNQRLLDGSPAMLYGTMNGTPKTLDLKNMMSFGEDSLELVEYVDDAQVFVFYSGGTQQINSNVNRLGIEVTGAEYSPPDDPDDELEDGDDYRIKVSYEGPNSTVSLTNSFLEPIKTIKNVDLTGNGNEDVDFGNGVKITINKNTAFSPAGVDKWDYERKGSVDFFADLGYKKVRRQDLLVDSESKFVKEADLKKAVSVATRDGGELSLGGVHYSATNISEETLEVGEYSVKINYFGANSTALLRDSSGRIVKMEGNVDLSAQGENVIDFGNGLTVAVNNDGTGRVPAEISGTIVVSETENAKSQEVSLVEGSDTSLDSDTGTLSFSAIETGLKPAKDEMLDTGKYSVEVSYVGANSVATIRDASGALVEFVTDLDLSAEGVNEVDLGNGVKLSLDNNAFGNASGSISAEFEIKDKARQSNAEEQDTAATAELVSTTDPFIDEDGNSLSISEARTGVIFPDEELLTEGTYKVEVLYYGKNSVVSLKDESGGSIKYEAPVDLSGDTKHIVSFKNGLDFVLDNHGFQGYGQKLKADIHYTPERTGVSAGFDFAAYAKQAEEAMAVVEDQMMLVDDTFVSINRQKKLYEQFQQLGSGASARSGVNAINLLSTSVNSDTVSVFSAGRGNSQAAINIQNIIATAGTSNAKSYSAADLISSSGNFNQNSVFGVLSGQSSFNSLF